MGLFKKLKFWEKDNKPVPVAKTDAEVAAHFKSPEQVRDEKMQKHLETLKQEAKKRYGYDEVQATKWAWQQVEKKMEKFRERGVPVACKVCKRSGANKDSGPMVRTADGEGMRHQNCQE